MINSSGSKLDQNQPNSSDNIVSEYLFLDDGSTAKPVQILNSLVKVLDDDETKNEHAERQPKNGAEAYESLVKSLTDSEYLKDISEEPMDEDFGLLEQFSASGLFQ